jgi:predicted DCC family thiol-disulfide oxidoreductase YuxK
MWTLLYDAECEFCRWTTAKLLDWDRHRRLRPLSLQTALAADLLPGMSVEDRLASFHLVGDDGTVLSAGKALPALVAELPRARPLGELMRRVQPITDLAYRAVSASRSRIGPLVPDRWKESADERIRQRQAELGEAGVAETERELDPAGR